MREGQFFGRQRPGRQPGKAFGFQPSNFGMQPGKAFGFGRQGRLLEERPKPGSQTRDVLPAQNVIAHLATSWIRERGLRAALKEDLAEPIEMNERRETAF